MNENLPKKEDKGFFRKIKNLFMKLFYQPNSKSDFEEITLKEDNIQKEKFEKELKIENDGYVSDIKRKEFLKEIEENPDLLYDLSNEKLEKLNEYYKELIKYNKLEVEKLEKELQKLKKYN